MEPNGFASLTTIIDFFKSAMPIIIAFLIVAIYLWTWKRSGSGFFILQRLLFLVGGSKNISDIRIDGAWQKVRDFYSIRLRTGIKFPSNSSITQSIDFLEKRGIGLEQIIPIRKYFNAETCEIRDPNVRGKKIECLVMAVFLLLVSSPIILLGIPNQALLKVKETDTIFWTDGKTAHSWNLFNWDLNPSSCHDAPSALSKRDMEIICKLLIDQETDFISNTVLKQRTLGAIFFIFSIFTFTAIYISYAKAQMAQEIRRRIAVQIPEQLKLF